MMATASRALVTMMTPGTKFASISATITENGRSGTNSPSRKSFSQLKLAAASPSTSFQITSNKPLLGESLMLSPPCQDRCFRLHQPRAWP